jgi:tetratricopeptide (TPR) repeat protein
VNLEEATLLEDEIDQAMSCGALDRAEQLARRYRSAARDIPESASPLPLTFRAAWLAAQVALAAGKLAECARLVASLVPLPAGAPKALRCRVWLAGAEALARLDRPEPARDWLDRAREEEQALASNPLLRLRELRIRLRLGELASLSDSLRACARALEQSGDRLHQVLLLCDEGRAWDVAGDLDRALDCWNRGEQLARPLGSDPVRADVFIQLARVDHLRGYFQSALDRYEAVLVWPLPAPQFLEANLRRLLVLLDLECHEQVRVALRSLLPDDPDQVPEELSALARMLRALTGDGTESASVEVRAYQAGREGDLAGARNLYEQGLEQASGPARRARLTLALGLLALACGDRAEAHRWLSEAERLARQENLPEVLWRTLQGYGQLAAELDGDEELARRCYEDAVLLSEEQAARLRHGSDALAHRLHRGEVLRRLLQATARRGDAAGMFRCQELERGRFLLDLWRSAPSPGRGPVVEDAELNDLDRQISACQESQRRREELLLQRDRVLDRRLRDRSRRDVAALPALPELDELQQILPPGTVYLAPSLVGEELHLLVVRPGKKPRIITAPDRPTRSAGRLRDQIDAFRSALFAQLERYRQGLPLGRTERHQLDMLLAEAGHGALGQALRTALEDSPAPGERIVQVPDGPLHGFPLHALRLDDRYLIESHEVVTVFAGSLFVHQARHRPRRRSGRALVVTESESVLPGAAREGEGVAATFWNVRRLHGPQANRAALRRCLPSVGVMHLACHALFDAHHPLDALVRLPSGESWRAVEWLHEPFDGLHLVTLSACRSAEVAPLVGQEVFGLVTGLLGSGVRAVVAGLWPVADREAGPFMWRFYRQRLLSDLPAALASAMRETLSLPDSSPLFWAAFALFGDPAACPAPRSWWGRWLGRWLQRRHERRFASPARGPIPESHP